MSTACNKCGISVMVRPLQRVNPIGENGIFWCEPCIEKNEPELFKNIQEDKTDVEKELENIIYNKN
jgi:hypothetical protein